MILLNAPYGAEVQFRMCGMNGDHQPTLLTLNR